MLRSGFAAGLAAYLLWGLFPLYWPLLEPAGPVEILAHRIVWSVVLLAAVLAFTQGFRWVRRLGRRRTLLLALASALITINWGAFIYGVNNGHVVETSLGYFINPLVTVALAVSVVGERLRPAQWAAVAIATVAVGVLTVAYGRPPWIALTLAFSFGFYGLVKKQVGVGGTQSLAVETSFLLAPALACVAWFAAERERDVPQRRPRARAAARERRRRDRGAADAVRRGRRPDPIGDDRPAPVPRADHALRDRRRDLRRGDAGLALGGLRARLDRGDRLQRRQPARARGGYGAAMIDEARLEQTEYGLAPATEGWFTVNVREAAWVTNEAMGAACVFEGDEVAFGQIGYTLAVLAPGQPSGMYHREGDQEDFLVLSGECIAIVEGEERTLRAWDFLHSPPGTEHIFVGAGDGPCVIFMAGARANRGSALYTRDETALRHGAGVETETPESSEAYARFPKWQPGRPAELPF